MKQETPSPAPLGADSGLGLPPASLGQINTDQLKEMITSAVAGAAATATPPPATTGFGGGARSKPRATSNVVGPSAPPKKSASQLNTTK
eukprot:3158373-Prymnesium_polylepis.1